MARLVLGPLLRQVDERSATVWVETDAPCVVEIAGSRANTFCVAGQHYALVVITGLRPGTSTPYDVRLDGEVVWPERGSDFPYSRIRTLGSTVDFEFRMVFGSCRLPEATTRRERGALGVDALVAYAHRMAGLAESAWPHALLLLGDQVYADEMSSATAEWLRARRGDAEPRDEVVDYEEYVRLYHESWSEPHVRWLMSILPTSMIFDDHDVRDDWNTSQAWRDEMARLPWWPGRIRAALMSYWVYQHIGNLEPAELAEDETYAKVTGAPPGTDVGDILAEFAERADTEAGGTKGTRWSYRRDFGPIRLLVIDTRSGRILAGGARSMLSDAEFDWIERNTDGDFAHLVIGSSLPWLMPPALSDLQSLNEVECRRSGWRGRFGEWFRQAADLEHWPSFRASFDRLARLVLRIARGAEGRDPATVLVLSGDVHHAYAAQAAYPGGAGAGVYQLTCSPVHNAVPLPMKLVFRLGWWRGAARVARWLAARGGVPELPLEWRRLSGPHFDNAIATLTLTGRRANMSLERASERDGRPCLTPLPVIPLTHEADPGGQSRKCGYIDGGRHATPEAGEATMGSIFGKIGEFARGPQGQRLVEQAKQVAQNPKNKEKVQRLTEQAKQAARDPKNKERVEELVAKLRRKR